MLFPTVAQWALPLILLNACHVLGGTLTPIRPNGNGNSKRDTSQLELKSTETFLWGDSGAADAALANLTIHMPGDHENILNMERFDGLVKDVKCSNTSITMTFKDDATFAHAQRVWDWVNGADNHSFVMVAGAGDCGDNPTRQPYVISKIQYDEVANKATLAAKAEDWKTIAHSYDLVVGSVSDGPEAGDKLRRDISKTASIGFNHKFPFSVAVSAQGLEARLACTDCGTTGSFKMKFTISQKFFVPTGASMTITPSGVSAVGQIKLSGSGEVKGKLGKEFKIIEIPIDGIKIPHVLDLGPFLTVSAGAELSAITVSAGVTAGAKASISNSAILKFNLLDPLKNQFSGWTPSVSPLAVKVDAAINGGVAVYLKPSVSLKADALGHGFEIGLNMKLPNINAKLSLINSKTGACPAPAKKTTRGVNVSANIGASLNIEAKKTGSAKALFTTQIAAIDHPLAKTCFAFGARVSRRGIGAPLMHATSLLGHETAA